MLAPSSSCPAQSVAPGQEGLLVNPSLGEEKPEPPAGSPEERGEEYSVEVKNSPRMHLAQQERACLCTGETVKLNLSPGREWGRAPQLEDNQEELSGSGFQGSLVLETVCCPGFRIFKIEVRVLI